MELDLALVADFVSLADERHFGRAAARRHMSTSALTKRIQRLERQVGCGLVERGPAGVTALSPAGRRFASSARQLLVQAEAARQAAQSVDRPGAVIRLGVPAGTGVVFGAVGMPRIATALQESFPGLRVTGVEVPFPELTRCLPTKQVDVLFTNAAVPHVAVESYPLQVTSARIGLVGPRHRLADAGSTTADELCRTPILYNPAVPEDNMSPLWLGDYRPRRDAQLVPVEASKQTDFLDLIARSADAAMVTYPIIAGPRNSLLRAVALSDAAAQHFYAACRRNDRRRPVRALMDAMLEVPAMLLGGPPPAGLAAAVPAGR